ncbi:aminoglycoside phosphotransferase (APT) family kinase protein [Lipingzhangella halophila]|uniref:Aminoglycoside phosphotransferase (APT) family kinase protein n=1 Tax=Lipingzhangella halophila TaxID=1783352 RepID=A0A7W7RHI8_9ACTN|nr:phosphotransferase family protein [Lipingzhangella halophila]MBB4932088.1 aminoglycoside phosphotransferase (APT) family kinase protein [Lipingzhangella halophila]
MGETNTPGLDLQRLREYLDAERPGLVRDELTGELITGGRSNLTYAVTDGQQRWAVRRPPLGHVLPTAHDMGREHRVISALAGTAVPVPPTVLYCDDPDAIGARFYVMEFVDGTAYRDADRLVAIGAQRTSDVVAAMVDTLVDLHAIDPSSVGLQDFGRPEGFLERQVRRWSKQLDASRSRDLPGIDELRDRLAAAMPTSPAPTIVHGDYRLDNLLVDESDQITAVLDWEMSTLGDPLTDLALIVAYNGGGVPAMSTRSNVHEAPGFPPIEEIIERYGKRSGRDVSALPWYAGFAYFKVAVILEGIHYRYTQGQTVGDDFDRIGEAVPSLISAGLSQLDAD